MRKRSSYRPKPVKLNAHEWTITGMRPVATATSEIVELRTKNFNALNQLLRGWASGFDIDTLIEANNICLALSLLGTGKDWTAEIGLSADALFAIAQRGGNYIGHANELAAINTMMGVHDLQLDKITVRGLEQAMALKNRAEKHKLGRTVAVGAS